MTRLVVVSNRVAKGGSGKGSAGGLVVGVMAAMERAGGLWFGWNGKIEKDIDQEPLVETTGNIDYVTVGIKQSEYNHYYNGFANSVLWPLFHQRPDLMNYRSADLAGYKAVNQRFARILQRFLKPDDVIWIHDYHLIPMGQMLRDAGVTSPMGFFLHTPFPPLDLLRTMPNHKHILRALMAYDLVGLQTETDRRSFAECLTFSIGATSGDGGEISANGATTVARVYPIGIETESIPDILQRGQNSSDFQRMRDSLNERKLIIGVDRLDYSKGLLQRFQAYERLLRTDHRFHRDIVYLQIAPVSRGDVKAYGDLAEKLDSAAGHIIGTYADFDWMPLRYLNRGFRRSTILAMYNLAHVGFVTPLRDGMNLVAKEYVAAQNPENPGVLVLSKMAGASAELDAAVIVNPYDQENVSRSLAKALVMPLDERVDRWQCMITVLKENNIHQWHRRFLSDLQRIHGKYPGATIITPASINARDTPRTH